ncbi:hypothetical protein WJX72_000725 [[Myrmecia] bisecta]|uniref:Uncharacterized protein n=1 Tax=[Myrmecia] bisecta TaxID=41462 RepID=A0AAW1QAX4_9CHLO
MFAVPVRPPLVFVRGKDDRKKDLRHTPSPPSPKHHHDLLHGDLTGLGTSPDTKHAHNPSHLRPTKFSEAAEEQDRQTAPVDDEEGAKEQPFEPPRGIASLLKPSNDMVVVS